jgi:hypothetical protein
MSVRPNLGNLRDLYIDGQAFPVDPRVYAHFAFLSSVITGMASNNQRLAERIARLEGEQFRERGAA